MMHNEPFRPQFHFTPPAHWLNDPNGLLFYKGEYHLFYQHYPKDTVWGPMHWGHAVSTDLINWMHLPIALYPDEAGHIYSGSAVIDWQNTAAFGKEAMVAIFTHHQPDNAKQSQSIAYSLDKGRTWKKYAGNPVIPTPENLPDFRDPKVLWFEKTGHWIMLLAARNAILFYKSPNLIAWEACGRFGFGYGATAGVWETPDLFQLPVNGGSESRWVLTVGVGDGAPAGGSGTQYFVGQFDGQAFTSENPKETVLWADWGADFYAAQSWSGIGNQNVHSRRIWLAWFNNWRYATVIPTSSWRGSMTIPRELSLIQTENGLRLGQKPVGELAKLRSKHFSQTAVTCRPAIPFNLNIEGDLLEVIAEFQIDPGTAVDQFGIRIRTTEEEATTIGYAPPSQTLFLDRSHSGLTNFSPDFPRLHKVEMQPSGGVIHLHIFVDRSSIELFGSEGLVAISDRIFPSRRPFQLEFFAKGGPVVLNALDVYLLKAADFWVANEAEL